MRKISLALGLLAYLAPGSFIVWVRSENDPSQGLFVLVMIAGVCMLALVASGIAAALRVAAQRDLSPRVAVSPARYRGELAFVASPMAIVVMLGLAALLTPAA